MGRELRAGCRAIEGTIARIDPGEWERRRPVCATAQSRRAIRGRQEEGLEGVGPSGAQGGLIRTQEGESWDAGRI